MKSTIDIALSKHIKQRFENYNPEFKKEYWTAFENKLNGKSKRIAWFWPTIVKAASVVILITAAPQQINKMTESYSLVLLPKTIDIQPEVISNEISTIQYSEAKASIHNTTNDEANLANNYISNLNNKVINIKQLERNTIPHQKFENISSEQELQFAVFLPEENITSTTSENDKMNYGFDITSAIGNQQNQLNTVFGGAIVASVKLSQKLKISSGISWQKNNELQQNSYEYASSEINSVITNETKNYNLFSIPLAISYKLKNNIGVKISSSVDYLGSVDEVKMASMQSNIYFSPTADLAADNTKYSNSISNHLSSTSEVNKLQLLNNMRLAFTYNVKKNKIDLNVEPFIQIPLISNDKIINNIPLMGLSLLYNIDFS